MIIQLPVSKSDNISFDFETDTDKILPDNIKSHKKAHIIGNLSRLNSGWRAEGKIDYEIEFKCDRCAKPVKDNRTVLFDEVFTTESNEEQYNYQGNKIDLTQLVIDAIIFDLPSSYLCAVECKGLCRLCGTNLNISTCNCKTDELSNNPFDILKEIGGDK